MLQPDQRPRRVGRGGQAGRLRQAPALHRPGRRAGRADPVPAGDLQRAVLLPQPGRALVRRRGAGARAHGRGPDPLRAQVQHGDGRARLRARAGRRVLQHRGRARRRRLLPRQVPQEPHPPHVGLLGEVLLQARQPGLPRLRDGLRSCGRVHLLRPPLPRGRAPARPQRRRDRVQPLGDGEGPVPVPVEARAAGPRGGQRLLHGLQQPCRHRGALEHRRVLRLELLRRPRAATSWPRAAPTGTSWWWPTWTSR